MREDTKTKALIKARSIERQLKGLTDRVYSAMRKNQNVDKKWKEIEEQEKLLAKLRYVEQSGTFPSFDARDLAKNPSCVTTYKITPQNRAEIINALEKNLRCIEGYEEKLWKVCAAQTISSLNKRVILRSIYLANKKE